MSDINTSENCTDVVTVEVHILGKSGKKFVEISDWSQLEALVGGAGKKVTVDGVEASEATGTPAAALQEEVPPAITVAPQKGGQG